MNLLERQRVAVMCQISVCFACSLLDLYSHITNLHVLTCPLIFVVQALEVILLNYVELEILLKQGTQSRAFEEELTTLRDAQTKLSSDLEVEKANVRSFEEMIVKKTNESFHKGFKEGCYKVVEANLSSPNFQ